jgi:hypothetical protein
MNIIANEYQPTIGGMSDGNSRRLEISTTSTCYDAGAIVAE